MLLAPAIALMAVEIRQRGARPYELTMLALLWLMPVAARPGE